MRWEYPFKSSNLSARNGSPILSDGSSVKTGAGEERLGKCSGHCTWGGLCPGHLWLWCRGTFIVCSHLKSAPKCIYLWYKICDQFLPQILSVIVPFKLGFLKCVACVTIAGGRLHCSPCPLYSAVSSCEGSNLLTDSLLNYSISYRNCPLICFCNKLHIQYCMEKRVTYFFYFFYMLLFSLLNFEGKTQP